MKLYNSKSNSIETFLPIEEGKVSIYLCGPTVYDYAHIGNARPPVVFDVWRRVFAASGYEVDYISNYTDIDDRIINKAIAEKVTPRIIADRYIAAYEDLKTSLNIEGLRDTPRVTETMESIVAFIQKLVDGGFAYEVSGDVYFRIDKAENYGAISNQNIEQLKVGARIEENTQKENPLDFVLWKKTDLGEKWDSPWSMGRPGWHSECVVMIHNHFKKKTIDIHGGGFDLKFPHHENESAQNKVLHNHDLANYWVHNAMINIDGEKMSKSLGNVIGAKDYVEQLGANVTRWLLLSTHYRLELSITDALIQQAQKELKRIGEVLKQAQLKIAISTEHLTPIIDNEFYVPFLNSLQDDLNIANGQEIIFSLVKKMNQLIREKEINVGLLNNYKITLETMLDLLGIKFKPLVISEEDKTTIKLWSEALGQKDFNNADVYRARLIDKGIL